MREAKPPRPAKAWAALYPGEALLAPERLHGSFGQAWADCLSQYRYRQETWSPLVTNAALKRAGYRVVRVRVVADE
jgi:phage terminase large subunit-like protein